jgi:hypothetical protein
MIDSTAHNGRLPLPLQCCFFACAGRATAAPAQPLPLCFTKHCCRHKRCVMFTPSDAAGTNAVCVLRHPGPFVMQDTLPSYRQLTRDHSRNQGVTRQTCSTQPSVAGEVPVQRSNSCHAEHACVLNGNAVVAGPACGVAVGKRF